MTKLKMINKFFLQWFFVRLTKCREKKVDDYEILSYDLMPDGSISSRGIGKTVTYQWYSIQYFILPTTGWNSDFIFLTKEANFIQLTKKKIWDIETT